MVCKPIVDVMKYDWYINHWMSVLKRVQSLEADYRRKREIGRSKEFRVSVVILSSVSPFGGK